MAGPGLKGRGRQCDCTTASPWVHPGAYAQGVLISVPSGVTDDNNHNLPSFASERVIILGTSHSLLLWNKPRRGIPKDYAGLTGGACTAVGTARQCNRKACSLRLLIAWCLSIALPGRMHLPDLQDSCESRPDVSLSLDISRAFSHVCNSVSEMQGF